MPLILVTCQGTLAESAVSAEEKIHVKCQDPHSVLLTVTQCLGLLPFLPSFPAVKREIVDKLILSEFN
jgi:hypothetical protein